MPDTTPNNQPSIYAYRGFAAFLSALMHWRKQENPRFSYRYLCKKLKLPSTSKVAMIATGKRLPTAKFLEELCEALGLSRDEFLYAEALVALEKAKGEDERALFEAKLEGLLPAAEATTIELDAFTFISQWHHIAILEMTELPDIETSPEALARRLGGLVGVAQVEESVELLQRLGLLRREESGRLARTAMAFTTPRNIPSAAIRGYHAQILDLAKRALEQQSVSERYFAGTTVPIDPALLPEAQKLVADFRKKLLKLANRAPPREVYHVSLQLFRLTEPE